MKGGTYSEALKVGFTSEQAGMLARLGGETRQEAVEDATNQVRNWALKHAETEQSRFDRYFYTTGGFLLGVIASFIWVHIS